MMAENRCRRMGKLAMVAATLLVANGAIGQVRMPLSPNGTEQRPFESDDSDVKRGYEAILAAISLVPALNGQRLQYQAQIAFALDQAQLDCSTTLAALDAVARQPGFQRSVYGALRDVTEAAARCSSNGIAAIDGGPAGLLLNAGPTIGSGGGSSNYGG